VKSPPATSRPDGEVEILNPEQPIATLGPDGAL
jgi:DNA-directed RNA polymerase alpha subunit